MNFHQSILSQAAFLDRPKSRRDLDRIVALMEEKSAVARERQRVGQEDTVKGNQEASRVTSVRSAELRVAPVKFWSCGRPGQLRRSCPQKSASPGNGQLPGGRGPPGQTS
jgi:hypothetical protein